LADLSYEQIIVDHPEEFSTRAQWFARRTLGLPNSTEKPPNPAALSTQKDPASKTLKPTPRRNPSWNRDELILALDLYMRFRTSPPSKESKEVLELSSFLSRMASARGEIDAETFRNPNGVYMKMMNFRRFDPNYTADGKVGLVRGNKLEEVVWDEFADNPAAVAQIRAGATSASAAAQDREAPYWVFVCNPKKWAIDRFFDQNIEYDTWVYALQIGSGLRPANLESCGSASIGGARGNVMENHPLSLGSMPYVRSRARHSAGAVQATNSGRTEKVENLAGQRSRSDTCVYSGTLRLPLRSSEPPDRTCLLFSLTVSKRHRSRLARRISMLSQSYWG
jgi:hypothetical protein